MMLSLLFLTVDLFWNGLLMIRSLARNLQSDKAGAVNDQLQGQPLSSSLVDFNNSRIGSRVLINLKFQTASSFVISVNSFSRKTGHQTYCLQKWREPPNRLAGPVLDHSNQCLSTVRSLHTANKPYYLDPVLKPVISVHNRNQHVSYCQNRPFLHFVLNPERREEWRRDCIFKVAPAL